MATPHEEYFDASLRHRIALRLYTAGQIRRLLDLIDQADASLIAMVRDRMAKLGAREDTRIKRLRDMIKEISGLRAEAMRELEQRTRAELLALGAVEARGELDLLLSVLPWQIEATAVSATQIRAMVTSTPYLGLDLGQWFEQLVDADRRRIVAAIQESFTLGETISETARRLSGTRAAGYTDGVLAITRRNAEAVARTAIQHVANQARQLVWQNTEGKLDRVRWVSTLDGRTTPICQARDGELFPIDSGPRPPAHFQCRSTVVAVLEGDKLIGQRPAVVDTRTRRKREISFRALAKEKAGDRWKSMSKTERNDLIRKERATWARERVGSVPAKTTYAQWLRRQKPEFVAEVLGQTKAKLFLRGGLSLDKFVDPRGKPYTLDQLQAKYRTAFDKIE